MSSDEREFLHAIATPISTINIAARCLIEDIQKKAGASGGAQITQQIQLIADCGERLTDLVRDRRDLLIQNRK